MQVNDRVTVRADGGPRQSGAMLVIESFSEGTIYLVSPEDYPLEIRLFNEVGHPDEVLVEKEASRNGAGGITVDLFQRRFT